MPSSSQMNLQERDRGKDRENFIKAWTWGRWSPWSLRLPWGLMALRGSLALFTGKSHNQWLWLRGVLWTLVYFRDRITKGSLSECLPFPTIHHNSRIFKLSRIIEIWKFDYTPGSGWLLTGKPIDFWSDRNILYLDKDVSCMSVYTQIHLLSYTLKVCSFYKLINST